MKISHFALLAWACLGYKCLYELFSLITRQLSLIVASFFTQNEDLLGSGFGLTMLSGVGTALTLCSIPDPAVRAPTQLEMTPTEIDESLHSRNELEVGRP